MAEKAVKAEKKPRVLMPEQEPHVRARNFKEVPWGIHRKWRWRRPSAVCSAKNLVVSRAARSASIFQALSNSFRRRNLPRPSEICGAKTACRRFAAAFAPRKSSAKASASSGKRASRSPSVTWSVLPRITKGSTAPVPCRPRPNRPANVWPLLGRDLRV
jgi:hypothetical protein